MLIHVAEQDASWKQRYLNLARDAADLLIESGFMSDALLRAIAIYIIACLKTQASACSQAHLLICLALPQGINRVKPAHHPAEWPKLRRRHWQTHKNRDKAWPTVCLSAILV